jgi:hypothetical protein
MIIINDNGCFVFLKKPNIQSLLLDWPRADNARCLRGVTACILEPVASIGELNDHVNMLCFLLFDLLLLNFAVV